MAFRLKDMSQARVSSDQYIRRHDSWRVSQETSSTTSLSSPENLQCSAALHTDVNVASEHDSLPLPESSLRVSTRIARPKNSVACSLPRNGVTTASHQTCCATAQHAGVSESNLHPLHVPYLQDDVFALWDSTTPPKNTYNSDHNDDLPSTTNTGTYTDVQHKESPSDPTEHCSFSQPVLSFPNEPVKCSMQRNCSSSVPCDAPRLPPSRTHRSASSCVNLPFCITWPRNASKNRNSPSYVYDSCIVPSEPLPNASKRLLYITEAPFLILWVYATYWAVVVCMTTHHSSCTIWLSAVVAGILVGIGLNANAYNHLRAELSHPELRLGHQHTPRRDTSPQRGQFDRKSCSPPTSLDWGMVIRFFLIPFAVSSLSGLTHSARADFLLVFPKKPQYLGIALLAPAAVVAALIVLRLFVLWRLRVRKSFRVLLFNGTLVS